jgi:polar amino acid transport system substrate-binding protein
MPRRLAAPAVVLLIVLGLLVAGCGGSKKKSSSSSSKAAIKAPSSIADSGKLIFCSDVTYPPEEFYKGSKPVGSDIEIGRQLAKYMGVEAEFDNTGFDGIIPALQGKKCDAIISGMNDTAERRQQVAFVDYINVGQSFMVKGGNPENIKGLPNLKGKSVSVELGTTNKTFLDEQNKKLGLGMKVTTFPKDNDAANALKTGKVDAYFGDAPVVADYVSKDPKSFTFGGAAVNPIPVGIAVRKDDTGLRQAIKKGVDKMYADGSMTKILGKWKMSSSALKQ